MDVFLWTSFFYFHSLRIWDHIYDTFSLFWLLFLFLQLEAPRVVHVYHEYRQPSGENVCHAHSCSHFCVRSTQGQSMCVCPDGFLLSLTDRSKCLNGEYNTHEYTQQFPHLTCIEHKLISWSLIIHCYHKRHIISSICYPWNDRVYRGSIKNNHSHNSDWPITPGKESHWSVKSPSWHGAGCCLGLPCGARSGCGGEWTNVEIYCYI